MDFEPKKLALLRIFEILFNYSDEDHPLLQEDIANKLSSEYGIDLERKAISRNISLLIDAGYDIESSRRGCYLARRDFENSELRLLIDGVLSSRYITPKHSKELIDKLIKQSNVYFKPSVKHVYSVDAWSKTENCAVFYNIDVVTEAINESRQIAFVYNKYGLDKKLHRSARHVATPLQLLLHNQRYYIMTYEDYWKKIVYYRLDHITEIVKTEKPAVDVRSIQGYKSGINYRALASMPYMFSDEPCRIEFIAAPYIIDQVIDWLGENIGIWDMGAGKIKVSCKVSPTAMEYWAMQYLNHIEIISPQTLREKIKSNLEAAVRKYNYDGYKYNGYVAFDIETTGFSGNDNVIKFAACKVSGGKKENFSSFVVCPHPLPEKIKDLTGITDDDLSDAPDLDQVVELFEEFSEGLPLVTTAKEFTKIFLGRYRIFGNMIDIFELAKKQFKLPYINFKSLLDYYEVTECADHVETIAILFGKLINK